jgi:penicillin V acylase-like amidase (Ntn superfamily)
MTGDPYVIEMHPDKGYASLFLCSYDLLGGAIDGVNEKGVAVALLADDMSSDKQPKAGYGLSELSLPRFVLDKCATAKEAREKLKAMPYFYTFTPCHYIICDASGDSFVWETRADLSRRFTVEGKGAPQIVTNHLLGQYNAQNLPSGNSFDRYRSLQGELAKRKTHSPAQVRENNFCAAVPKEASGHATLWHSVYDLQSKTMQVSFYLGTGRRTEYFEFALGK